MQLPVTATYQDGHSAVVDAASVTWQSSAPGLVSYVNGWLVATGAGGATVTASTGGQSATVLIQVDGANFLAWGQTDIAAYRAAPQRNFLSWGQTSILEYRAAPQKNFLSWGQTNVTVSH